VRRPRFSLSGQPQHVIQRGNNRMAIFTSPADYARFYRRLQQACFRYECVVHAYVLMPNHVHLLMTPATPTGIGRVMQSVGTAYAQYFNAAQHRTGAIWEGRYRAIPIDTEKYLLTCYRYIERNPVRAGLVGDAAHHRWSSYRANAFGERDPLVTPHARYLALGLDPRTRQTFYRALHGDDLSPTALDEVRAAIHSGSALGTEDFRREIEQRR
jgi:REP-associated tyrosine transposase